MSRINTNVSSITAQNNLGRSNTDLQTSLTRLSTGLRINSGKDDPAGLIASETLRRDITAVDKAITNSQKAGQLIATADSALGQVSNLLNDIRGLVTEAANAGVLSDEQIAAQQLQVDSSLEAIDRIASATTFQGRKILDGSLGFVLSEGSGYSTVADLQIDQANLGATGSVGVNIEVSAAASRASVTNSIPATATGQITFDSQTFSINTTLASGLDSVTVAVAQNTGPEATGSVTIDGRSFNITAASGETGIDAVTVTTAKADHAAEGTATIDDTDFAIVAAPGSSFDGAAVVTAKSDLGLAKSASAVVFTGAGGTATLGTVEVLGGHANLSTKNGVTVALTTTTAVDSANYDVGTNTLTVNIDSTDTTTARTGAYLEGLVESATIDNVASPVNGGVTFDVTGATESGSGITTGAGGISGGTTLTQEEAQATFSAGTNELTITLNSNADATVTGAFVDTVVTNLSEIASVTPTGATNINVAGHVAGNVGTLDRVGVKAGYVDGSPDTITLTFDNGRTDIAVSEVIAAIDGLTEFSGTTSTSAGTATINGTSFTTGSSVGALNRIDGAAASFDASSNVLTVTFDGSDTAVTSAEVIAAIDAVTEFENTAATGTGTIDGSAVTVSGDYATAGRVQDLVVRIGGELGSEVFSFQAGTTFQQIADAIELVSDATGVTANVNGSSLELSSADYGSNSFVDVEVISEGAGGTFKNDLSGLRGTGTDIAARVNGVQADGDGNTLSINTATLDLSLTVDEGSSTDIDFTIDGGGAVFQLGPDVVSNQQAQIGIQSIATGKLGGVSGRLYELRSGGAKALGTDVTGAQRVVDETIVEVVGLRGRLGAFQATTLDSNIASLQDTLVNLTDAESSIRDADFAKESAALTRAQILVQSGTSVLAIANQSPQNVLALLG